MQQLLYTLACPQCNNSLPQALKKKELLETMEVNCPHGCKWKYPKTVSDGNGRLVEKWFFLAKDAIVETKTLEEFIGANYPSDGLAEDEISWKEYQDILKECKVPLDDMFKDKNK